MRWQGRRQSGKVEDRRRMAGPMMIGGGGGIGLLLLILVAILFGADPAALLRMLGDGGGPAPGGGNPPLVAENDPMRDFVGVVLADTEEVWGELFQKEIGKQYREPELVLFSGRVNSACGFQSAAIGPFYCPPDQRVYIDLQFYEELKSSLGAPGDFAQAYVIAHEVGHHVQNLLGISDDVRIRQRGRSEEEVNQLSVRLELQADFFAGVWAHHAQKNWDILEEGDIEEALQAAAAIGDNRLQMKAQGYVVPESFTHGTSEQRVRWFLRGFKTGDIDQGDTFTPEYREL